MGETTEFDVSKLTSNPVAQSFIASFGKAKHETEPFDHWLFENTLPKEDVDSLITLSSTPPKDMVLDGKRETNNAFRLFFTRENQEKFSVCRHIAAGFKDPHVKKAIEETTGADLTGCRLRIEYCQDPPGFWLEPHTDIFVKKFTMLVYLLDDPSLELAGTDIHEGPPDFKYVATAPYGRNRGVIFIPGKNTWHGVGHHPIQGLRKSIIINYVTSDWRDTWELA